MINLKDSLNTNTDSPSFDDLINQLTQDGDDYQKAVDQENTDEATLKKLNEELAKIKDPSKALAFWLTTIAPLQDRISTDKLTIQSKALKTQNDFQKLTNFVQNEYNTDMSDNAIDTEAHHLDTLLTILDPNNAKSQDWIKNIQAAIGAQTPGDTSPLQQALQDAFSKARSEMYVTGDDQFNPTGTYYLSDDTSNTSCFHSFKELQDAMKGTPDSPDGPTTDDANNVNKDMLNGFNSATSATDSANKATQVLIQAQMTLQKALESFWSDMAHAINDIIKTCIQNQR